MIKFTAWYHLRFLRCLLNIRTELKEKGSNRTSGVFLGITLVKIRPVWSGRWLKFRPSLYSRCREYTSLFRPFVGGSTCLNRSNCVTPLRLSNPVFVAFTRCWQWCLLRDGYKASLKLVSRLNQNLLSLR